MFYRFLLFVSLLFVITFYIMTEGLTHNATEQMGSDSWGGVTPGWSVWTTCTDESADHPTITAYASANVTGYRRNDPYGSGSGNGKANLDEYGLGHSRVSADTLTITIGGESETHEPSGKVYHEAFIYFTGVSRNGSTRDYIYIIGDNIVYEISSTDYEGPYSESTSAYNSIGHPRADNWYLTGKGRSRITNIKEELLSGGNTSASASAEAP